jgi:hypothetical protein
VTGKEGLAIGKGDPRIGIAGGKMLIEMVGIGMGRAQVQDLVDDTSWRE